MDVKSVMEKSLILMLSFSRLRAKRAVSSSEVEVDADKSMIHVAKDILDSEELRAVSSYDRETKRWLRRRVSADLEFLSGGAYLLSVDLYADANEWLATRAKGRAEVIAAFKKAYPERVKEAKKRLGKLFDADEYPDVKTVEQYFAMEFGWMEVGPSQKLKKIDVKQYEKEARKYEDKMKSVVEDIRLGLRAGLAELVGHLAERLSGKDGDEPKRFRASALTKMTEFLDLFEKRDLTNDVETRKLVERAKRLVAGVDADQIRDDEKLRKRVAEGFTAIKASVDGMLEGKPSRAISLADEDV